MFGTATPTIWAIIAIGFGIFIAVLLGVPAMRAFFVGVVLSYGGWILLGLREGLAGMAVMAGFGILVMIPAVPALALFALAGAGVLRIKRRMAFGKKSAS